MIQYENENKPEVKGQTIAIKDYVTVSSELIEALDELDVKDTIYYIETECVVGYADEENKQPIKSDKLWFVSDLPKPELKAAMSKLEDVFKAYSNEHTKRK